MIDLTFMKNINRTSSFNSDKSLPTLTGTTTNKVPNINTLAVKFLEESLKNTIKRTVNYYY